MVVEPTLRSAQGARIYMQIKSCTVTVFWLRDSLYPMTFAALSQGLRRDGFLAKVPGPCPDAASGNSHRRILAPRYSDIKCRNLTLGPR